MTQINMYIRKRNKLVDLLVKTDLRHKHELYICSCYFNADSAKKVIKDLVDAIKITRVSLFIDRREAILKGASELKQFLAEAKKIVETNMLVVDHSPLFHTKAYAVVSMVDGDCRCGSLVVGSANLTIPGLIGAKGNIESLLDTQDITYLAEFVDGLEALPAMEIDEIAIFRGAGSTVFKLALLNSGRFVYKWSGNLHQYMTIRYVLNEKGRAGLRSSETSEAVSPLGFNIDSATIGKSYFHFSYESAMNVNENVNFIRNFGIETHFGHWVPKVVLDLVINQGGEDYERFKREILAYWGREEGGIIGSAEADYMALLEFGIVDAQESEPGDVLRARVESLLENETRLWRIYSKYAISEMPFDISQDDLIDEAHDEIIETIESRSNKNKSMKAYIEAVGQSSLDPIAELARLDGFFEAI